jgi:hypothetical protein
VDWETFLKLYCIFEMGNIEKTKLINFWSKFFDQDLKGSSPPEEYLDVLEKLVRGRLMQKSSEFTKVFALRYQKHMQKCGILDAQKNLVIDKFQQAYLDKKLDISTLSASLGREQ